MPHTQQPVQHEGAAGVHPAALWVPGLALALALGLLGLSRAGIETSFWTLSAWLHGVAHDPGDSWAVMALAFERVRAPDAPPLYELLLVEGVKFQYPPSSLLLYAALDALGLPASAALLNAVGRGAVLVNALAVAALAMRLGRTLPDGPRLPRRDALLLAAGLLMLTLLFYPVVRAYALGQLQSWINALFALACVAWAWGRPAGAGMLIGLACLLKPQFVLFAAWALLRGHRGFLAGWAAVVLPGTLLSLLQFGWHDHLDYLHALGFISRHGESFHANQSVNGLLHRLLSNGNNLQWDAHAFAPYHPAVHALTLASSALLLLLAFARRPAPGPAARLLDFGTAALAITMASPVAWEHHYGVLPPLLAVLLLCGLRGGAASQRRTALTWTAALLLCASFVPQLNLLADTPFNVLQSHLFLGALLTLALALAQGRAMARGLAHPRPLQDAHLPHPGVPTP